MSYWIIFFVFMGLSLIVSQTLKSKFNKYSQIRLSSGMTGKDVAEKMLRDNGIYDVKVVSPAYRTNLCPRRSSSRSKTVR